MKTASLTLILIAMLSDPAAGQAPGQVPSLRSDQARFRTLLREFVETDTSLATGSCTLLADKIATRLKQAGFTDSEITRFAVEEHPKDGGMVVILPGRSRTAKPLLLVGHLDVVVAKREDWDRDPYTLVEEGGYFYGRGVYDMKALDAIWVDTMIRLREAGRRPVRTVKLALTCGEETSTAFNGMQWLTANRPALISAGLALNEGGGLRTDGRGKIVVSTMQAGEKAAINYRIEATNPGGHSSMPVRDNAIYQLADAIGKVRDHQFPILLNATTSAYLRAAGRARGDALGDAMLALADGSRDPAVVALVDADRSYHAMVRTTCVATLLDGGHANNALPQRAGVNVNCRILPGMGPDAVRDELERIVADPRMTITTLDAGAPLAVPPPLSADIIAPAERLLAQHFPGTSLAPEMATVATDAIFLGTIGIPVYGPPGIPVDPDGNGAHGLNERVNAALLYQGRDYLYALVASYADCDKRCR